MDAVTGRCSWNSFTLFELIMTEQKSKITGFDRFKVFMRCFFVQGSWNFKALLGVGFGYCMVPVVKKLYKTPEEQEAFLRRHIVFFNSHPYFASWCVGAVVKLEEDSIEQEWPDREMINVFKERLVGPLGIIGDKLFWSGIKPMASAFGVGLAFFIGWPATPIYLLIYNIPHLFIRYKGMRLGYKMGFQIVSELSMQRFQKLSNFIISAGLFAGGILLIGGINWAVERDLSVVSGYLVSALFAAIALKHRKSINFILYGVIIFSILTGILFHFLSKGL